MSAICSCGAGLSQDDIKHLAPCHYATAGAKSEYRADQREEAKADAEREAAVKASAATEASATKRASAVKAAATKKAEAGQPSVAPYRRTW